MKMANIPGSMPASTAIFCICSSLKVSAFCFSSGVITATAFFNCSNSALLGAASIANSLLPLMSLNWVRTMLPNLLSANRATSSRYCSIEIFWFTAVLCSLFALAISFTSTRLYFDVSSNGFGFSTQPAGRRFAPLRSTSPRSRRASSAKASRCFTTFGWCCARLFFSAMSFSRS